LILPNLLRTPRIDQSNLNVKKFFFFQFIAVFSNPRTFFRQALPRWWRIFVFTRFPDKK